MARSRAERPRPAFDTVSFLSDFGLADEFVGVVHRVVLGLAPWVTVVDLTHEISSHDVRAGALALWRSAPWLAPGVVLAVVDPGVGTPRRRVAIEAAGGALVFVGPDNGLLVPAAYLDGPPSRAVVLSDPAWHLPAPAGSGRRRGATFDGRDVFGPVAAHLCTGVDLAELGELLDPAELVGAPLALAGGGPEELRAGGLDAEVLWVDRYGNAQLAVLPETLDALGPSVAVQVLSPGAGGGAAEVPVRGAGGAAAPVPVRGAGRVAAPVPTPGDARVAVRAHAYAELAAGELGLIPDSAGLLALCLDQASAADELGLRAGLVVHLGALPGPTARTTGAPPATDPLHTPAERTEPGSPDTLGV